MFGICLKLLITRLPNAVWSASMLGEVDLMMIRSGRNASCACTARQLTRPQQLKAILFLITCRDFLQRHRATKCQRSQPVFTPAHFLDPVDCVGTLKRAEACAPERGIYPASMSAQFRNV